MKKIKKEKVKRGKIILSAILTMLTAIISLGFGAYLGYVTLNINYLTIGTMTPAVGGLLVCAGFFIFFGCIGGVISLKEIFISSRNEEKFSAYKPALISAMIYYVIIAIIGIIGIIVALVSFIPSSYTWSIVGLALLSLLLCAGAFYLVLKELKDHKKKIKAREEGQARGEENGEIANLNPSASDIRDFSAAKLVDEKNSGNAHYSENSRSFQRNENANHSDASGVFDKKHLYEKYMEEKKEEKEIDFTVLAEKLMQLEELRKAGLINDQEYQTLKSKCI